jgi:hypothetical protein
MSRGKHDPEAVARALELVDEGCSQHAAWELTGVPSSTLSGYRSERDGRPRHESRDCWQCGGLFHVPPSRPKQRFCSASCAGWYRNGKPGRPPTVTSLKRSCRLCGTDITELHGRARYCTPRRARKGYDVFGPVVDEPQPA